MSSSKNMRRAKNLHLLSKKSKRSLRLNLKRQNVYRKFWLKWSKNLLKMSLMSLIWMMRKLQNKTTSNPKFKQLKFWKKVLTKKRSQWKDLKMSPIKAWRKRKQKKFLSLTMKKVRVFIRGIITMLSLRMMRLSIMEATRSCTDVMIKTMPGEMLPLDQLVHQDMK